MKNGVNLKTKENKDEMPRTGYEVLETRGYL
jgi:hypothetical protein